tara:strand:- start:104 stop:370 length:267 start_codon:yes stop_codon:yes gene_type:complete
LHQFIKQIIEKKDLEYIQKLKTQDQNKVKIMLKRIEDKEDNMTLTSEIFFRHMSDEDFIAVIKAGQMENLCNALAVDLQKTKTTKYEA